jgi:hypothetical protein
VTTQVDQNRGDENGRISQAQSDVQPKDTKSLPYSWSGDEPVYVVERRPFEEHSAYTIWVKHDGIKVSPNELTKLLADVLQSQVRVSDLVKENPDDK